MLEKFVNWLIWFYPMLINREVSVLQILFYHNDSTFSPIFYNGQKMGIIRLAIIHKMIFSGKPTLRKSVNR